VNFNAESSLFIQITKYKSLILMGGKKPLIHNIMILLCEYAHRSPYFISLRIINFRLLRVSTHFNKIKYY